LHDRRLPGSDRRDDHHRRPGLGDLRGHRADRTAGHAMAAPSGGRGQVTLLTGRAGVGFTLEGVGLGYGGNAVLRNIDLEIEPGEVLVVVGASGSGKSTLLRALAGLLPPYEGRILAGGAEVRGPSPERAMVFQDDALLPWRTVLR